MNTYASRLKSDLRAFPELQELQIYGRSESSNPLNITEVYRNPMIMLETARDEAFLNVVIQRLQIYSITTPGSYLDIAWQSTRPHTIIRKAVLRSRYQNE